MICPIFFLKKRNSLTLLISKYWTWKGGRVNSKKKKKKKKMKLLAQLLIFLVLFANLQIQVFCEKVKDEFQNQLIETKDDTNVEGGCGCSQPKTQKGFSFKKIFQIIYLLNVV